MTDRDTGSTLGSTDEEAADHMADALTYLGRVAADAGYHAVAADILAVRDKLALIALGEKAQRKRANA